LRPFAAIGSGPEDRRRGVGSGTGRGAGERIVAVNHGTGRCAQRTEQAVPGAGSRRVECRERALMRSPRRRDRVTVVGGFLALLCALAASQAEAKKPKAAPSAKAKEQELVDRITRQPLIFFVARGERNACGPGCNAWIAAEGHIDLE